MSRTSPFFRPVLVVSVFKYEYNGSITSRATNIFPEIERTAYGQGWITAIHLRFPAQVADRTILLWM